jgi:hemerythrin-like domain-containing protein
MCDDCGCREKWPIDELSDEHAAMAALGDGIRAALADGRGDDARAGFAQLAELLDRHCDKEETGLFAVLREEHELPVEVAGALADHKGADRLVAALPEEGWDDAVVEFLDGLDRHCRREERDIFPATRVAVSDHGWDRVEAAHRAAGSTR